MNLITSMARESLKDQFFNRRKADKGIIIFSALVVAMGLLCLLTVPAMAATDLNTGDLAFIGINTDGDDDFAFVLLKDISAGTSVKITDKGWNDAVGFSSYSGDGTWQWSTDSNLTAGAIVHIKTSNNGVISADSLSASPGSVVWLENSSTTTISYAGDQLFLYQGEEGNPDLIAGIHWNVETGTTISNWDGSSVAATTSALPNQLTNGVNAIWVYDQATAAEKDNFRYNGSTTSGTPSELRAAINNLNNWEVDLTNSTAYTLNPFPCSFIVNIVYVNPTVPTLTAIPTSIVSGGSATLSISGDLNDATAWYIYAGSCGGSSIGSTADASFAVSPPVTTTYYVRGEGGGVTPGSCATVTVTVNPAITSVTFDAETGTLIVSGTNFKAKTGDANDITIAKLTLRGEGGAAYTLTTSDVEIDSATQFTVTLNATDVEAINRIINKNGDSSTGGTTYNLAASDDWCTNITDGDISDTANTLAVSNVAIPAITSAAYDADTGELVVTGTGFLTLSGDANDIVTNKLTITGEGEATYTLTSDSVEITSGTSFAVTLNTADKEAVNQIINKNGPSSILGTKYNLAAAEDWAAGADGAIVVADLSDNEIMVSNVTITTATVTTTAASSISAASVTLGGNVTADGGAAVTERGIVYSATDTTPTIAEGATKVTIGSGTGSFSASVDSLTATTTYYVRAFATNIAGTSYGDEIYFITTDNEFDECFIATAAFDSKFTWPVALLRQFRDQYLMTNIVGTAFVNFYYKNSPPIAAIIASSKLLKLLVRVFLAPVIAGVYIIYHPVILVVILFLYIGLSAACRSRLRRRYV